MFDRYLIHPLCKPLGQLAQLSEKLGCTADRMTLCGFLFAILAFLALTFSLFIAALLCILINRLCDGLDGALARRAGSSDAGAFLLFP